MRKYHILNASSEISLCAKFQPVCILCAKFKLVSILCAKFQPVSILVSILCAKFQPVGILCAKFQPVSILCVKFQLVSILCTKFQPVSIPYIQLPSNLPEWICNAHRLIVLSCDLQEPGLHAQHTSSTFTLSCSNSRFHCNVIFPLPPVSLWKRDQPVQHCPVSSPTTHPHTHITDELYAQRSLRYSWTSTNQMTMCADAKTVSKADPTTHLWGYAQPPLMIMYNPPQWPCTCIYSYMYLYSSLKTVMLNKNLLQPFQIATQNANQ